MIVRRRQMIQASAGILAALAGLPSWAQQQVLRLVVGFPPGGSGDTFARLIAEQLRQELNTSIVVENREGAGGLVAAEAFVRAPADGNHYMLHTASSAVFAPVVRKKPPYDPLKDFQWVAQLSVAPLVVVANPSLPVTNLKTFLDYLRGKPDEPYGSAGIGASTHLAAELLLDRAGSIKSLHVPYKGSGPSLVDTMAGRVTFMLETLQTTMPLHAAGKLKILAVMSESRVAAAPDIPTTKEFGIDAIASTYNLMAAPVNAPKERVDVVARALVKVMTGEEFRKRLNSQGIEPVADSNPERARAFVAAEVARWAPLAKKLGIEV
jgi:tripartite-type tricarboxylate transporter receptor subunit TctC